MHNLLIIDDDIELNTLMKEYFSSEQFDVDTATDGEKGLTKILNKKYDIVLLDVVMPRMDGFETLRLIRQFTDIPVIMMTAKGDSLDNIMGFEASANDIIHKPFSERELLSRIQTILRQEQLNQPEYSRKIEHLDIKLYPSRQQAECQDFTIDLTGTELRLLEKFLVNPGELYSKEVLSEEVLGKKLQRFDRSIDMHLSNIRRKLPTRHDGLTRVKNFRGRGYMWVDADENVVAA